MNLTHEDVQEVVKVLDDSSFTELVLETDRYKLTLRRTGSGWTQERETAQMRERAAAPSIDRGETEVVLDPGVKGIHAPLVGTFYRAPKPGAAPFVEAGSRVEPETVVAIIETMKLMNSVHAGVRGIVAEICADNGEFVEQARMLMKVREDA